VVGLHRAAGDNSDAPRLVLAAHSDEIGFMVRHIDDRGFLRVAVVGGIHAHTSTSQRVVVHGRETVKGVIVPVHPEHMKPESLTTADLVVDLGLPAGRVRELVQVGDPVSYAQEFEQLNDDVVLGRNFDDRIGTYCLVQAMREVGETQVEVHAASTVQEELGVRGATVVGNATLPTIAVAIDGSLPRGPYVEEHVWTTDFGGGTGIYVMDRLTMGSPKLVSFLVELCERRGIAYQRNVGGGTDASALQRSGVGALATTIGAPVRYMHSTVQLCHVDDIDATVALLVALMESAHELLE
jgi:endoglucanase